MDSYGLLDNAEEGKLSKLIGCRECPPLTIPDAIHANRLLGVEDKFFKRLQRRLTATDSPLSLPLQSPPTPPPDSEAVDESASANVKSLEQQLKDRNRWHQEVLIDFAAFESSIQRAQFLFKSNERERQRYAQEKDRILQTADAVRQRNTQLHEKLRQAQATLARRKTYDDLAELITKNPALKPRDQQQTEIEKLHLEIADLKRAGDEHVGICIQRRAQFDRMVQEGEAMMRLIRGEREQPERLDDMEILDDGVMTRPSSSYAATPRPMEEAAGVESSIAMNMPLEAIKRLERSEAPASPGTSRATTPAVPNASLKSDGAIPMDGKNARSSGFQDGAGHDSGDVPEQMDTS